MDFVLFIKDNFLGAKDNIIFAHGETEKNLLSKIPGTEDYIYQTSLLYNGLKSGLLVFFFSHRAASTQNYSNTKTGHCSEIHSVRPLYELVMLVNQQSIQELQQ